MISNSLHMHGVPRLHSRTPCMCRLFEIMEHLSGCICTLQLSEDGCVKLSTLSLSQDYGDKPLKVLIICIMQVTQ